MKILMVTEDLPAPQVGGLGKHVVTLSNALIKAGHEVVILGRSDYNYDACAEEIGFAGKFISGFHLKRVGWKEEQLGFFNPFKRPFFARKVAKAINLYGSSFDVVHYHGHLPMVGRYVDPSINFVQTRHDQGSECLIHLRFRDRQICKDFAPEACARCAHFNPGGLRTFVTAWAVKRYRRETKDTFATRKTIFVSNFLQQQFHRAVPDANFEKCEIIHNFINEDRLLKIAENEESVKGSIVLVGRMEYGKGFRSFLEEAYERIPESAVIFVVGDGPDRCELESKYASRQIRFLGWLPYEEVIKLTAKSHLCVVPSLLEEACSTTVLEALALGKPCFALKNGSTPELAVYERYAHQLQLACTMRELVDSLFQESEIFPSKNIVSQSKFGADISQILPKILKVYERQI